MSDLPRPDYRDRIADEAAHWYVRMQDGEANAADRSAFADWLSASPEHVHEYLALAALHTDVSELAGTPSMDDLIRRADKAPKEEKVIRLERSPPISALAAPVKGIAGSRFAISRRRALWAATVALAMIGGWWGLHQRSVGLLYSTDIGEQKSFTLPDGSVVTLNAVSRINLDYTDRYRDIELLSGEALFTVAKNADRPFRVLTDDSVIQAVGTRFNVRRRYAQTTITVIEGRVKVAAPNSSKPAKGPAATDRPQSSRQQGRAAEPTVAAWVPVAAGQSAMIDAPGVIEVSPVDATANIAWRERRLIFDSRPLQEVVAEFNLYNESALEIRDGTLNEVRVSGSFYANDPQSFALFLAEAKLARPQVEPGRIRLLAYAPTK